MLGMRVEVEGYGTCHQEVVHYSPNWVTWANKEGLVGVVKHVDV